MAHRNRVYSKTSLPPKRDKALIFLPISATSTQYHNTAQPLQYDRPSVGKSEDNNRYPNLKNRADDLKHLLTGLGAEPPYILIGHSIGGLYIRGYAGFYPNDVAGLVFIDPADFTETKEQWRIPFSKVGVPEKRIDEMLYERFYQVKNLTMESTFKIVYPNGSIIGTT